MRAIKLEASFPLESVAQQLDIFPLRVTRIGETLVVELDEFDSVVLEVYLETLKKGE